MRGSMRSPACVLWLAVLLAASALPASAQRLFARQESVVYEIATSRSGFGQASGLLFVPPGCAAADSLVSLKTWVIDAGGYLAWERFGGVCLLDTRSGRVRSLVTEAFAAIVAVRASGFGLVVAHHTLPGIGGQGRERLFLLNAPEAEWQVIDLAAVLPPPPVFSASIWSYDISADGGELVVVESRNFGNRTLPLMTRVSIATGAVLGVASVAANVLVGEIAVSRDGSLAVMVSDDWYLGANGVLTVNIVTGAVVAANASILPHKLADIASDSLVWDESAQRVLVVTQASAGGQLASSVHVLEASTLAVVAVVDAPRIRVPLRPENDRQRLAYALVSDPGTGTAFLVEDESQTYRYSGGGTHLRTVLYAINLSTGAIRQSVDLSRIYGLAAARLPQLAFLIPAPEAPSPPSARVAGSVIAITWAPVPGVSHYVLEGGTAAGLANLGAVNLGQPSFSVTGVPPGRYYLRVRAVGVGGQGPRSADVVVNVP